MVKYFRLCGRLSASMPLAHVVHLAKYPKRPVPRLRGLEKFACIGGAWATNCYPGARCDSPAPFYQFLDASLSDGWKWSQRFPHRNEILAYFAYVDSKVNISQEYDFEVSVTKAEFDENESIWNIDVSDGRTLSARWLVPAVGFASHISIPDIQGLGKFQGAVIHTGAWPSSGYNLKDKKVAVIGTGTSANQVIREIEPRVSSMTVYQRSPAIVLPQSPTVPESTTSSFSLSEDEKMTFAAKSLSTFTGFDYQFLSPHAVPAGSPQRLRYYDHVYKKGGWKSVFFQF
ncbi:hypothetical protein N7478_005993 [Penicillium angulare]|uniref:uncharacterized protein n=1 Tax=Penicillium angulare TaxID=116970 RepID=UPI0025413FC0|nr:uncharacterized protein N7478_005993 [Penicillium angulare]KAJ5280621.1 hypothetical protein N7478_005993 [Penicillium angulare]